MTAKSKWRILFYVQHLLGVGHVFRARRLIEGFVEAGLAVDLVFGGVPVGDMDFSAESLHLLPPVKAGAIDYSFNVTGDGEPLTDAYMAARQKKLLKILAGLKPDCIIIEQWPFGRRPFRHELKAMIEVARKRQPRPLVVSSVRDILQEKRKPGRHEEALTLFNDLFDKLIVHSDPAVCPLEATFPLFDRLIRRPDYTGFVTGRFDVGDKADVEQFDIICTVGGGAFGEGLIRAARAAAETPGMEQFSWCLSTGPNLPEDVAVDIAKELPSHISVRRFIPALAEHLSKAKVSISQCGYNTTMDILSAQTRAGTRAVLVPSDIGGQTEQLRRAELLADANRAICLPESRLSPTALAEAIGQALKREPTIEPIDFNGVANTAALVRGWLEEK